MQKNGLIDSGPITVAPQHECTHEHDCDCEIDAVAPSQDIPAKWEFKPRQQPKWGTVTREGLVVGRGANKKVIPPDEVWKLAALGCTMEEMAEWFQINRETLKYNFSDYIAKGRAELKRRLRAAQIRVAMDGNPTMLVWLGKNLLGQSDNPMNNDDNQPLPWNDL